MGVIPFDTTNSLIYKLNPEQLNDSRSRIQRKEIEVALHGFNHKNELKPAFLGRVSYREFASVDFDKQYEKLAKGKRALYSL